MADMQLVSLQNVELRGKVRQEGYSPEGDGNTQVARMTPRGELVTSDLMQQFVFDGRAYNVSNTARETALASGASFSDTAPFALLYVPAGTTIIPLQIFLNTKVDDKTQTVLVTMSDKTRYTSGGTAHVPQNLRFDEPKGSACSFYSMGTAIVANSNTDDITLVAYHAQIEDYNASGNWRTLEWTARRYIAPALVGPASLVIYHYGSDTMAVFFSIAWGEMGTDDFKRSI